MKKAQFNFVWIFALLVGASILALAIFGATRTGSTADAEKSAFLAKSILVLTNPLQAGFSDASYGEIILGSEAKIENSCNSIDFGESEIGVFVRKGGGWSLRGPRVSVKNRYIFSNRTVEGERVGVFSLPFNFPYKVADLLILLDENYCFEGAPKNFKTTLLNLKSPYLSFGNCGSNATKVCFGSGRSCDVVVSCTGSCERGSVKRDGKSVEFAGNLIYAAIFSDSKVYSCNVKRLLFRARTLAEEFAEKSKLLAARPGCGSRLDTDLASWKNLLSGRRQSLGSLYNSMKGLENKNSALRCRVWR